MTPERIAELRRIVELANLHGPIETRTYGLDMGGYDQITIVQHGTGGPERTVFTGRARQGHSDLLVAAVNALPDLLEEVERLSAPGTGAPQGQS
jgi:hypothetical protein